MFKTTMILGAVAVLTACSGPSNRLDMPAVQSQLELRAGVGSAMLRTISLPSYAAAEEIAIEDANGLITASRVLWADEPERAVTLAVTTHLSQILTARIGPDPWPFVGLPDVSIDVRVQKMLAGADGQFRLTGQYYIGGDGIDYPNTDTSFAITTTLDGTGAAAVARAQSQALLQLSENIAQKLAR